MLVNKAKNALQARSIRRHGQKTKAPSRLRRRNLRVGFRYFYEKGLSSGYREASHAALLLLARNGRVSCYLEGTDSLLGVRTVDRGQLVAGIDTPV